MLSYPVVQSIDNTKGDGHAFFSRNSEVYDRGFM